MRKIYSKLNAVIFGAVVWLMVAPGVAQAQAKLDAFIGNWLGAGVAETKADTSRFQLAQRELDVDIRPAGTGGFEIIWSTKQKLRNQTGTAEGGWKLTTLVFVPAGEGQWSTTSGDPLNGGQFAWARIEDNSLVIRTFKVDEEGNGESQLYRRTVTGDTMELFYMRAVDGEIKRTAMGRLARKAT